MRIAAGQIIVDGHHVDAAAFARVPDDGRRAGEGLAFPGLHFGDATAGEGQRAAKLHVEHFEAEYARGNHGDDGHGLLQVAS